MRDPPEQPPGLGERRHVAGPPRQHGRLRERRRRGRLGRLGHQQQRVARGHLVLQRALPRHSVHQHRRVEANARALRGPPGRDPLRRCSRRRPAERPIAVGHVVTDLGRREHQRHRRGELCPSPRAADAERVPRNAHGPALRRRPAACASTRAEITSES
ncbi:hypothetical protein AB0F91_32335 [Amycolatopsis sp. NPDC023774]|uniref:hypothetical protein n=1 Tax=Amycolatopsis sp. NPDC023774 TaxID=3155015 RepID=UPI00340F6EC3